MLALPLLACHWGEECVAHHTEHHEAWSQIIIMPIGKLFVPMYIRHPASDEEVCDHWVAQGGHNQERKESERE